jgi:hypothetical protein
LIVGLLEGREDDEAVLDLLLTFPFFGSAQVKEIPVSWA